MGFHEDARQIERIVMRDDPSFDFADKDATADLLDELRALADGEDRDRFLLGAMRLMALPGNGHTRLIPNSVVAVAPLRFVRLGAAIFLTAAPAAFGGFLDSELVAINDVPVASIEAAAAPFLSGVPQRRRAIGGLLFVWPAALRALGVTTTSDDVVYVLADAQGRMRELRGPFGPSVRGDTIYPVSERGGLDATAGATAFCSMQDLSADTLYLKAPSFFDPTGVALGSAMEQASAEILRRQPRRLVLDLRGNPGGNFTRADPLVNTLTTAWDGETCAIVVDKFTFSAAIVVVALLKHGLGNRAVLLGEPMGDGAHFFAEGGTVELPQSGATVRYSTAAHDWEFGVPTPSTPPEIARRLVAAGALAVTCAPAPTARDLRLGHDPVLLDLAHPDS
jgi:hypothetical protein